MSGCTWQFVDISADIQTASLLLCYFSMAPRAKEPDAASASSPATWELWLDEYRDMLDRWQMWEQRCILDIALASLLQVPLCSAPSTSPCFSLPPPFAPCTRPSRPPMRTCPLRQTSRLGARMHARAGAWAQPTRAAVGLSPHCVQLLSDPHHAHRQPAVVCGRGCGLGGGGGRFRRGRERLPVRAM